MELKAAADWLLEERREDGTLKRAFNDTHLCALDDSEATH